MRVDNWDTKLSNYIVEQSKTKFVRGKTDCVNFILGGIEVIIGRKVFDREYKSLKEAYGLNAKEIGLLVGKSRPFIANLLRISNLSQKVQEALKEEKISFGQARPLIVLEQSMQDKLLTEITSLSLNSRQVEERVSVLSGRSSLSEEVLHLKSDLENILGSKVQVKKSGKTFKVNLNFKNIETLKNFIEILN